MLTEAQIEIAARKLCELYGLDPKYFLNEAIKQVNAYRPEIGQAIAYAQQEPTNGNN